MKNRSKKIIMALVISLPMIAFTAHNAFGKTHEEQAWDAIRDAKEELENPNPDAENYDKAANKFYKAGREFLWAGKDDEAARALIRSAENWVKKAEIADQKGYPSNGAKIRISFAGRSYKEAGDAYSLIHKYKEAADAYTKAAEQQEKGGNFYIEWNKGNYEGYVERSGENGRDAARLKRVEEEAIDRYGEAVRELQQKASEARQKANRTDL